MRRRLLMLGLLFLVVAGSVACDAKRANAENSFSTGKSSQDADEHAIYSVLLSQLYADRSRPVILSQETSLDGLTADQVSVDLTWAKRNRANIVSADLVGNFMVNNSKPLMLVDDFEPSLRVVILSKQEISIIGQEKDGWRNFLAKYPGNSIVTLSRVGFDGPKNYGLVYTGEQSGGRTGRGQYVVLQREAGLWVIRLKVPVWVS